MQYPYFHKHRCDCYRAQTWQLSTQSLGCSTETLILILFLIITGLTWIVELKLLYMPFSNMTFYFSPLEFIAVRRKSDPNSCSQLLQKQSLSKLDEVTGSGYWAHDFNGWSQYFIILQRKHQTRPLAPQHHEPSDFPEEQHSFLFFYFWHLNYDF